MYGPSFFTGALIARFGAPRIVATGLLLEAGAATIGLSGITAMHFWATLIVLGVGWNFGFVGASALVLETHRPQERNKVQAFNDFLVFGAMAIGSFSSGQLLANYGWSAVNKVVLPAGAAGACGADARLLRQTPRRLACRRADSRSQHLIARDGSAFVEACWLADSAKAAVPGRDSVSDGARDASQGSASWTRLKPGTITR